jgi:hypothetical protein
MNANFLYSSKKLLLVENAQGPCTINLFMVVIKSEPQ